MWFIVLIVVGLGILAYWDTIKPRNYPPGPKWLPIFGSLLGLANQRKKETYLSIAIANMTKKYGPLIGFRIGKVPLVVAVGYDAVKELYTNEHLQGRPKGPFYETRTWGVRRGVLLTDKQFWAEQHRFVLRQLREFGFGRRDMGLMIEDEAAQLVKDIKEIVSEGGPNGTIVKMNEVFGVYVLNTLWQMMAGKRYSTDDVELVELQKLLTELFENIDMIGAPFSQFPILRYIAPVSSGYSNFIDIHVRLWAFLRNEINLHKDTYKPGVHRDFIDVYLTELKKEDKPSSFSEQQLMALLLDFFMAGSETTTKSMSFEFLYLLLNPEVQKKAQEEIDRVIGHDRLPMLTDRVNMPYNEALTLETVRIFLIKGFGVPHRALKDTTLQGYNIPKDTMVIANMNDVLHIDDDPEAFRPDRFIKDGKVFIPDRYMPFGFGKRRCIGEALAKANIFIMTTTLLQKFNFNVPPGYPKPSTKGFDGVTPSTGLYYANITARN